MNLCVVSKGSFTKEDYMELYNFFKDDIAKYLEMDKPFDCAGGYKYESTAGNQLFSKVEVGDPTSIQGLCLNFLKEQLT